MSILIYWFFNQGQLKSKKNTALILLKFKSIGDIRLLSKKFLLSKFAYLVLTED